MARRRWGASPAPYAPWAAVHDAVTISATCCRNWGWIGYPHSRGWSAPEVGRSVRRIHEAQNHEFIWSSRHVIDALLAFAGGWKPSPDTGGSQCIAECEDAPTGSRSRFWRASVRRDPRDRRSPTSVGDLSAVLRPHDPLKNLFGFRAFFVIWVDRGEKNSVVAVDHVHRRNWQFPAFVSIDERQIDEGPAVDRLLVVGNAVFQAILAGNLIAGIAEQRKT